MIFVAVPWPFRDIYQPAMVPRDVMNDLKFGGQALADSNLNFNRTSNHYLLILENILLTIFHSPFIFSIFI